MNDKLLQLKREHNLTNKDISRLCYTSLAAAQSWSSGRRTMPEGYIKLLQLQIERGKA